MQMRKIEKQMEDKNKKERELHTAFRATLTQMEVRRTAETETHFETLA